MLKTVCLGIPFLPSWSTEELVEVVGKECGKLDLLIDILNLSSVCIGSFWFQGIHLGSQAVKPSLALTSCSPHISSPTAVRH